LRKKEKIVISLQMDEQKGKGGSCRGGGNRGFGVEGGKPENRGGGKRSKSFIF